MWLVVCVLTGKREAEDEIAKLVSAKKQKKDVAVAQAVEKKKSDLKTQKKKKPVSSSSDDSSSESESEDDKVIHAPNYLHVVCKEFWFVLHWITGFMCLIPIFYAATGAS